MRRIRSAGALTWLLTAVALITGLAATGAVAVFMTHQANDAAEDALRQRTELVGQVTQSEAERYESALRLVAATAASAGPLTLEVFEAVTSPLRSMELAGATSIAFIAPAIGEDKTAIVEARWRRRGYLGLQLDPHPGPPMHAFSIFSRPLDGNTEVRTGIDVSAAPLAYVTLEEAQRTGEVEISEPYRLLIDKDLPDAEQQQSFVMVAPLNGGPSAKPRGWILMGIRGQDFMGGLLARTAQGAVAVDLVAQSGEDPQVVTSIDAQGDPVGPGGATTSGTISGNLDSSTEVRVAQTQWNLRTSAAPSALAGASYDVPTIVGVAGSTLSLLLSWLVFVLATGRALARSQVAVATKELRRAEKDARRDAVLLAAVVNSISDAVQVVDGEGNFLIHNPAARRLFGDDRTAATAITPTATATATGAGRESDGLFRPDGTPFAADEHPLVLALAGHASDGVELLLRSQARPEGLPISVTASPLDATSGVEGAVAVSRDVSDERERHSELAAFAGVVAHDLKNPLTAVTGYLDVLRDLTLPHIPAQNSSALMALEFFDRADRGAARMNTLIQGLLDFTTARDAKYDLRPLDLQDAVAEVVAVHLDHAAPGSHSPRITWQVPSTYVQADAQRLHQVLNNLIGNAIKYTRHGETPDITISVHQQAKAVSLCVSDRGIGIAEDQLDRVLEPFHRVDPTSSAGTGLGLAISHNIVIRHQGTLRAKPNPGGGTRFTLTLPATNRPHPEPVEPHHAPVGVSGRER